MLLLRCSTGLAGGPAFGGAASGEPASGGPDAPAASAPVAPAAGVPNASAAYRVEFQAVWRAVRDEFYDENTAGLDWSAVGDEYRARLGQVKGDAAFAALVNGMLGKLGASHTRLFTPDDFEFYLLPELFARPPGRRLTHIGVLTRPEQPTVVAGVLHGSPAARAGLRPGDVLASVDGVPYTGLARFRNKAGQEVRLGFRRGGETLFARVRPVRAGALPALLEATQRSVRVLRPERGRSVGYIRLWAMTAGRFRAVLENAVTGPLHDTSGLILDLRGGFGGSPEGFEEVFFRPDISVWSRRRGQGAGRQSQRGYNRPLVVLIDGGTRSAKEWLAWTLQRSGRATLVGERSAGAVLAANGIPISERFFLSLAVADLKLGGERLEGRGVTPDVSVPSGSGDAAYLQKAVEALHRIEKGRREPAIRGDA